CSGTGGVPLRTLPRPTTPSTPASSSRPPVTTSRASQVDRTVAIAAAAAASANASANKPKSAAPTSRPIPSPSATTFFLSSAAASSSSSLTIERARSATSFAAPPRPGRSPARMGMASPVDQLGEHDAAEQRGADHDERAGFHSGFLLPGAGSGKRYATGGR